MDSASASSSALAGKKISVSVPRQAARSVQRPTFTIWTTLPGRTSFRDADHTCVGRSAPLHAARSNGPRDLCSLRGAAAETTNEVRHSSFDETAASTVPAATPDKQQKE